MGNHSYQRHLNQEQADTIEAFLAFDGGDRKQLSDELWEAAKDKVEHYWREGTHDALEELHARDWLVGIRDDSPNPRSGYWWQQRTLGDERRRLPETRMPTN